MSLESKTYLNPLPLLLTANVSQASHTWLDHILLTLGNLFRWYSDVSESAKFDEDLRLGVINSLERRWKKTDQDVFIVAVFLNPYIRAKLFRQQFLTEAQLYNITERVYECVMRCKADLGFMDAFDSYKRSRAKLYLAPRIPGGIPVVLPGRPGLHQES